MRAPFLSTVFSLFALVTATHAQFTAFTYQGQLKNGTALASGPHDLRVRLFDAASGGTQLGTTLCLNNVPVTDGNFTATVDFGQQFATTVSRFLEIDVRADFGSPCTDVFGYVTLTPRQPITPAPRAAAANTAFALSAPDGSPANALFVTNDGRVGIGTTTPGHSVTIANPLPTLALHDTDSTTDQAGYISYRDGQNVEKAWVGYGSPGDPDFSIINSRTFGDIILNPFTGNVGIGTASPTVKLDVRGGIRLGSSGQYAALAGEESLRVVRGTVSPTSDCSAVPATSGTGFTVTNLSCGEIRVNFTPAFTGTPVVVASAEWDFSAGSRYVTCSNISPGGASMRVFVNNGDNVRARFSFMAVGPR